MGNGNNHHLYKRGYGWYFEIVLPKRLGGERIRASLRTGNIQEARYIRDTYLMPVVSKAGAIEALEQIGANITSLEASIQPMLEEMKAHVLGYGQNITLEEGFEKYLKYIKHSGLRKSSLRDYKDAVQSLVDFFGNNYEINMLRKEDAVKIRNSMQQDVISSARLNFKFQRFKGFLKWCAEEGIAKSAAFENFQIPLPSVKSKHTKAISEPNADKAMLIKARWTLVPRIARYTGMRLQEILRITQNEIIEVLGIKCIFVDKRAKTGRERIVPIADKLLPYMNDLTELKNTKRQYNDYNTKIKKLDPEYKFHCWRSYAISQMTKNGIDPVVRMQVVGHKTSGQFKTHADYTTVEMQQMKEAVDKIF